MSNPFMAAINKAASIEWWGNRYGRYRANSNGFHDAAKNQDLDIKAATERLNKMNDLMVDLFRNQAQMAFMLHECWRSMENWAPVEPHLQNKLASLEGLRLQWARTLEDYQKI